jgi:tetratricopeptide (TPR) repeat protein
MTLPPLSPGKIPPFHTLGDDTFEDLCRELLQEEENVQGAERYGTRGQRQEGIDLLIEYRDEPKAAGQCKSHEHCDEALIKDACSTFLRHKKRWRDEGIRTFILILAADTRRTQLHRERARQRQRLRRAGFSFKVWSGAVLKSKLRKHRHIVRHFLPLLEDYVCGPQTQLEVRAEAQDATIKTLAQHVGEGVESDHAEIRTLWQEGHPRRALERLKALRADKDTWAVLPASTKAKVLRLHGRLLLNAGQPSEAKALAKEAEQFDPTGGGRLAAMIAQAEHRLDDAIEVLTNDHDPDSQALAAAVLIQKGEIDSALTIISTLPNHPDAHRLHALILLSRGDVQQAKKEAEIALSLAPTWYWMKRTAASLRYFASLSPIAVPKGIPDWPEPVNSSLVRQDDESVTARKLATAEFESLARDHEHSADEIACLETWRLACLVDAPESRKDATDAARAALTSDPGNYRVVTWVLSRQLDVQIDTAAEFLSRKNQEKTADLEEVISLIAVHVSAKRLGEARALLTEARESFVRERAEPLYEFWDIQLRRLESVEQRQGGDSQVQSPSQTAPPDGATEATHPEIRWQRFALLAQQGRWDEIAPSASDLLDSVQTADAIRIACHALYNIGDFAGCLAMLDRAPAYYAGGVVAPDLRRLRILAQRAVGALPAAIRDARNAFELSASPATLMELARLLFQVGDLKSLAVHARQHQTLPDLSTNDCLALAFFVRLEDAPLAITLWRRAMAAGIADDRVGVAYEIGSNLSLDIELKPLVHRIAALGAQGKGGVKAFDIHELIQWATQRRQHLDQIWERYRRGAIPGHTALGILGINFATAFHRAPILTAGRMDGVSAGPVLVRFGGRVAGSVPSTDEHKWRLNADITALLTAAHFEVLEAIEGAFGPIRIPQTTIVALEHIEHKLRPVQPLRIEAKRQLIDAVLSGTIATVDTAPITEREGEPDVADDVLKLLRRARTDDALLLDFLPLRASDPTQHVSTLPSEDANRLRDAHAAVDALLASGALSVAEHGDAVERLGQRHGLPSLFEIPAGAALLCRGNVLELMALAGVLAPLAASFRVSVSIEDLREAQAEVAYAATAGLDADWVQRLVRRIREGLSAGLYEALPAVNTVSEAAGDHEPTPEETVLLELIQFKADGSDIVWTDDRWFTSHQHRDAARVAGTVDLLTLLTQRGQRTEAEVLQTLTEMRASDLRFIAFDEQELVAGLLEAPIEDDRLVETKPLRVARQYYARCLLEADMLRPPSGSSEVPNNTTEWTFLLSCGMAVATTIGRLWDRGSAQEAAVRSEWLLRNLYVDDRGMFGTVIPRTEGNDVFRIAVASAGLITTALQISNRRARRDYLRWVHHRMLRSRFAADPVLAIAVAEQLKQTLEKSINKDDPNSPVVTLLMRRLWTDLPKAIRALLERDQDLLRVLGISMTSVVEIGPMRLDRRALWETLASVLRQRVPAQLRTLDGHAVDITLTSEPPTFAMKCEPLGFDGRVGGDEFWFLSDSIAEREAAAGRVPQWFDLPKNRRDELIARIVGSHDPTTRMDLALDARNSSGEVFYRRIFESLKEGENFQRDDTVPGGPDILVNHLRVEDGKEPKRTWSERAQELIHDVGLVAAMGRLGGLPVDLTDTYANALELMTATERRRALRAIRHMLMGSPVGVVHIVRLWSRISSASRRGAKIRSRLAGLFLAESALPLFDGWRAVLRWTDEQLSYKHTVRELPTDIRLALVWTHADRVFRILLARGLPPDWIQQAFSDNANAVTHDFVFPDPAYSNDVASPEHIDAQSVALAALDVLAPNDDIAPELAVRFAETFEQLPPDRRWRAVCAMMADKGGTTNALGSWLSSGRAWLQLAPGTLRDDLREDAVSARIRDACSGILAGSDVREHWWSLRTALGSVAPSDQSIGQVDSVARQLSLSDYLRRDVILTVVAGDLMGSLSRYFAPQTREHLERQFVDVASELAKATLTEEQREAVSTVIVNGLVICAWSRDAETRAEALAKLLEELDTVAPVVLQRNKLFVLRLCETLPASAARHFWRVRELLRRRTRI